MGSERPPVKKIVRRVASQIGTRVTLQEIQADKVVQRQSSMTAFHAMARRSVSLPIKPSDESKLRPTSPNSVWQQTTLASLKFLPKDELPSVPRAARSLKKATSVRQDLTVSIVDNPGTPTEGRGTEQKPSTPNKRPEVTVSQKQLEALKTALPDAEAVLARLRGGDAGFSQSEKDRMQGAFKHFQVPDSTDIHKDDLCAVLKHLGYCQVEADEVATIASGVSEFATLEYNEFTTFITKYAAHEAAKYRAIFERFDEDNSGSLDDEEIMKFLSAIGYTPIRHTVKEAVSMVDLDGNGTLDFEELVLLINLYRLHEGFTADEVAKLGQLFAEEQKELPQTPSRKRAADAPIIDATKLPQVLTKFFGPSHKDLASKLSSEFSAKHPAPGEDEGEKVLPTSLRFSDALVWARRLREMEFKNYQEAFNKFDADGSGDIDLEELNVLLSSLGYTLPQESIDWLMSTSSAAGDCPTNEDGSMPEELDFGAFVHLMRTLSETDGFMPHEMDEIRAAFEKFDADGSGDIDTIELNDMLHYMGYSTKLDDMHRLIAQVDYRPDGTLDFRSFVRFMRLHREALLSTYRQIFDTFKGPGGELLQLDARKCLLVLQDEANRPFSDLSTHLAEVKVLGIDPTEDEGIMAVEVADSLTYADFITLADQWRNRRAIEVRKRAGFSDSEIARFQELFDQFDDRKVGVLKADQVWWLLTSLGFQFRSTEERAVVVGQLNQARDRAAELGAATAVAPEVDFWVLVQLLRDLFRRDDKVALDKVARAAQMSKFSAHEVAEFQQVFNELYTRDEMYSGGEGPDQSDMMPTFSEALVKEPAKALTKASLLRLMKSLGLKVTADHRELLDARVKEYGEDERVDFAGFLRIMRWMVDADFAGISKTGARA